MLGLPHISANSYCPMAYHCARYYITGLIICQLPGSHNTKASTLYTYHHMCILKRLSFNTYHIPQYNHIYFYHQFHNHQYIPISTTSIYHHNSQSKYIITHSYIFFTNDYVTINTFQFQHPFIITILNLNIS